MKSAGVYSNVRVADSTRQHVYVACMQTRHLPGYGDDLNVECKHQPRQAWNT
jgi:hypothetical protein